jgi:uncharacterized SAM-dependent methyltransferase
VVVAATADLATLRALIAITGPGSVVAVDPARAVLERTATALRCELPELDLHVVVDELAHAYDVPAPRHAWQHTLVYCGGELFGELAPGAAAQLLARLCDRDRLLLVGADSTRDEDALLHAYDARAAFHKRALVHLALAGATLDPDAFEHRVAWNRARSRIELSLVSTTRQLVRVDREPIVLVAGEAIATEHAYKHTPDALTALFAAAGWRPRRIVSATERPYRLWLCEPR